MSEPANRPLKPDGTPYKPGERLAMAAAKMSTGRAPIQKETKKVSAVPKSHSFESEIDRALRLMRGGR